MWWEWFLYGGFIITAAGLIGLTLTLHILGRKLKILAENPEKAEA